MALPQCPREAVGRTVGRRTIEALAEGRSFYRGRSEAARRSAAAAPTDALRSANSPLRHRADLSETGVVQPRLHDALRRRPGPTNGAAQAAPRVPTCDRRTFRLPTAFLHRWHRCPFEPAGIARRKEAHPCTRSRATRSA